MNDLLKAHIRILQVLRLGPIESDVLSQLSLITAISNAHHLSLVGNVVVSTCFAGENQLPVFHNVKTVEMGSSYYDRWLLLILDRSPLLETLVFPEGFYAGCDSADDNRILEFAALEAEGLRTVEERRIPSCLITHLKRIKLFLYAGFNRDLNIIEFLLGKASVLEEFVISITQDINAKNYRDLPDLDQFAITLAELPRASNSCSVLLGRESNLPIWPYPLLSSSSPSAAFFWA